MDKRLPEHLRVVQLIRDVGVAGLGLFDGCACSRFSVRNVDVDVGCGKGGERGVWVSSLSLDYCNEQTYAPDELLLRPIAEEVVRQVEQADGRGPIAIHLGSKRGAKAAA